MHEFSRTLFQTLLGYTNPEIVLTAASDATVPGMQNGLRKRRPFFDRQSDTDYLRLPLESMVMPPGPFSFLASFSLRVPMALALHSLADATSFATSSALP